MSLPQVVSQQEWTEARKALLVKENELTRTRDRLNTERRMLPMVRVDQDYRFDGPDATVTLLDLFDGRRQLIITHFMFDPDWDEGCGSCSAGHDEIADGFLRHLHARDTTYVSVSRAPLAKIEAYKAKKGYTFPWVSSAGSDFSYDFHASFNESLESPEYNYRPVTVEVGQKYEGPGLSCFLRDGDTLYHTYSAYARGLESTGGSYYFLDLTVLGRQEDWEEPKDRAPRYKNMPNFEE
jgi:predicted dithiol-disulfide oxidoreductase (DUF899 family)